MMQRKVLRKYDVYVLIIIFICIGAVLRFYNSNWDLGHYFHPDERNIANAVVKIHFFDQLDPGFFAYGGFSIYLYRFLGDVLVFVSKQQSWINDWGYIDVIGRTCSAFFSTITILPVFFLTKKLFNNITAIFSALFITFGVTFIQTAHFSITETIITLTAVLLCYVSVNLYEKPTIKWYLLSGLILGMAVATKTTSLSLIIFPLAAQLFAYYKKPLRICLQESYLFILQLLVSSVTFIVFSPYTFLDWKKFLESMQYESGVATVSLPVVYTYQFNHTPAYFYQLVNFFFQLCPISLFIAPSILFLLVQSVRTKNPRYIIFLLFPIVYFLYVGSWHTKFIRYMVPILPFFIISISYFLTTVLI